MSSRDSVLDPNLEFRLVTVEEVEHFNRHGWVKLSQFVPPHKISEMLAYAKDRMGDDARKGADPDSFSYFNALPVHGLEKPAFGSVLQHFGR